MAFSRYSLDLRFYTPPWASAALATQGYWSQATGDVPFHMWSLMGGRNLMRGVYLGRFAADLAERINLRLDLAWSEYKPALYFSIFEAF
jgi:hypothetical protein